MLEILIHQLMYAALIALLSVGTFLVLSWQLAGRFPAAARSFGRWLERKLPTSEATVV